jgi:hypothetical protein
MFKKDRYKTTLAGIGAVVTGVAMILKGSTVEGVATVLTGIGLITAKDA